MQKNNLARNRESKVTTITVVLLLAIFTALAFYASAESANLDDGKTSPSGYTIVTGAVGTEGASVNSSTYNATITGSSTPVGVGNNTNYNVSLGYVHTLDKNASPTSINISINKSQQDVKINDIINVTANATGDDELAFGWIVDNITGTNRNYTFKLSGTTAQFSQNITINISRDSVIQFTAYTNNTVGVVKQSNPITITVNNTLPPQVNLISPNTSNTTINRTPNFNWEEAADADGDKIIYNIQITCVECSSDNRDLNTTNTNITPSELLFLGDDNFFYNWSVRAYDNSSNGETAAGPFSETRNITINSFVSLALYNGTVNFTQLAVGQNGNTTDNDPEPFRMENKGNVYSNVSIRAADDLWSSEANPTDKFQFKAGNVTDEVGSFNWTTSITDFTNMPTAAVVAVADLDYHDSTDTAETDIKVEVPGDEPPGVKQSKVVFEAKRSK